MIAPLEIERLILARLPGSEVAVSDMTGSGDHFEIRVTSVLFRGKSLLEQHRMLHDILEEEMKDRIHAVKYRTRAA